MQGGGGGVVLVSGSLRYVGHILLASVSQNILLAEEELRDMLQCLLTFPETLLGLFFS